jgi:hypothetical protein
MDLILSFPGILGLAVHVLAFLYFAQLLPLRALSLPCFAVLTSFLYFYFMPVIVVMAGNNFVFGTELTSLEDAHWVTLLYVLGVILACAMSKKRLRVIPLVADEKPLPFNRYVFLGLWAVFLASMATLAWLGQLNLMRDDDVQIMFTDTPLAFLNLGFSIALSMTVICLVRDNFGIRSVAVLTTVLYIFSVAGFRFRIFILLASTAIAFMVVRKIRIRVPLVLAGAVVGIGLMNLIGMVRQYGRGFQFDRLESLSVADVLTGFAGESGIVYVTQYAASTPPDWIWFDPWLVSIARLVPSFIWPDKPTADYLRLFATHFYDRDVAMSSGLAAPQQVEMLYQFGWAGVFGIAFLYFVLISRLQSAIGRLSCDARIAGLAIIPPFFGYYMQSRGYFYQMFLEAIFTFTPPFLVHLGMTGRHRGFAGWFRRTRPKAGSIRSAPARTVSA